VSRTAETGLGSAQRLLRLRDELILCRAMNIIERAYQLATESGSLEEVKRKLNGEGYAQVHAHLAGKQTRHEILSRLNRNLVSYRK
jgi:vacuolar-type H+-ATPase subunit C/Vma6